MINEFHTALVYRKPAQGVVGEDYQESSLVYPELPNYAKAIRQCLLVTTDRPESTNWRAAEIRRCIERSDLARMLSRFDSRTGYRLDELITEMSQMFRPQVRGNPYPQQIKVEGRYSYRTYRLDTWTISVDATNWQIASPYHNTLSGAIGGQSLVRSILPGHLGSITFPASVPGEYWVSWAARPQYSMADTAAELRTSHRQAIDSLLQDSRSKFPYEDRELLRGIVLGDAEDIAQVCAAALLLAGHTAHHVSHQNRSSVTSASL